MRGDFEADTGGYPIAAMPTGAVKGEYYVMEMTMMNKLLDGNVVSKEAAVQVAGFLNNSIRTAGLGKDWATLNNASLERYNAIKDEVPALKPVEVIPQPVEEPVIPEPEGDPTPPSPTAEDHALVAITQGTDETNATLVAIIAEATGPKDDESGTDTGRVDTSSDSTVPEVVEPPAELKAPATLKAPAK